MFANRYGLLVDVCFVVIVSFLAFGATFEIPCPECHGTGTIQLNGGLNSQELVFGRPVITTEGIQLGCSRSDLFQVRVNLTLSNEGKTDWSGWIQANVTVAGQAGWSSPAYVKVHLKPGSTESYVVAVMADITSLRNQGFWGAPQFESSLQVAQGVIPCPLCGGTGKITLFAWIFALLEGKTSAP